MTTESMNDKLSIKNLLFTKAIPNYVIKVPTEGHRLYGCIDCGDKFMIASSYEYHVNRKSVKITYMCRHCNQLKIFYNRCNLLSHIRSHAFKTATINVSDLNVEPLPLSHYTPNINQVDKSPDTEIPQDSNKPRPKSKNTCICVECDKDITDTGIKFKDRAKHFRGDHDTNVHPCPVCQFLFRTKCALKAHIRIHLKAQPYICPECGVLLMAEKACFPYDHECPSFKMMNATALLKCPLEKNKVLLHHPNEYKDHMKEKHIKKVYKCPACVVACFNENTIKKHLATHKSKIKPTVFFQCEMCPGRLVLISQLEYHLRGHPHVLMYPCWGCDSTFEDPHSLIRHCSNKHRQSDTELSDIIKELNITAEHNKLMYRVVKRCDKCKRSFVYKCHFDKINSLPNECPFKCSFKPSAALKSKENGNIKCQICKETVSQNWEVIKKHFKDNHKSIKCVDVHVMLKRLDLSKHADKIAVASKLYRRTRTKKKIHKITTEKKQTKIDNDTAVTDLSGFICKICNHNSDTKDLLETHLLTHRDPCMAYQCMECGKCFVVKGSFSTHLLLEHNITDAQEYINSKQCYNEDALTKNQNNEVPFGPLQENQCNICRDQFDNSADLEKHFRVHGMAFLMKNTNQKNPSP